MHQISLFMDFVFVDLPTCWNLLIIPTLMLVVTSWSLVHVCRAAKMWSCPTCTFPVRCLLVSSLAVNKHPFHGVLSTVFYTFLCFLWVIWLFNMALKPSADMLSRVPKCRKAGVCFMEKRGVLDKCHPGTCCSALGCEFEVSDQQNTLNKVALNWDTL